MYCPKCGTVNTGKRCNCGWKPGGSGGDHLMPTVQDVKNEVIAILNQRKEGGIHLPDIMDNQPIKAADWLLGLFEGHGKNESPFPRTGKNGKFWCWPYAERITRLTKQFLNLDSDFHSLIVAARQDRVGWRGEGKAEFYSVINETARMRKIGLEEYRKEAVKKMKKMNFSTSEKKA